VLQKVYAVERKEIQQHLSDLLEQGLVGMEKPAVFLKALECYGESTLDFVDTLLWAYQLLEQQEVFTFDDKLLKQIRRTAGEVGEIRKA
jgi:predicted nucleic-acid-binding protein